MDEKKTTEKIDLEKLEAVSGGYDGPMPSFEKEKCPGCGSKNFTVRPGIDCGPHANWFLFKCNDCGFDWGNLYSV